MPKPAVNVSFSVTEQQLAVALRVLAEYCEFNATEAGPAIPPNSIGFAVTCEAIPSETHPDGGFTVFTAAFVGCDADAELAIPPHRSTSLRSALYGLSRAAGAALAD